jgi:hypothetical protein
MNKRRNRRPVLTTKHLHWSRSRSQIPKSINRAAPFVVRAYSDDRIESRPSPSGPRRIRLSAAPPLFVGISVDLKPRAPQSWDAVSIDVSLPGDKLVDRDIVELTYLLDRYPTAAHRLDNGGLATHRPPLCRPWQLGYRIQPLVIRRGNPKLQYLGPATTKHRRTAALEFRMSGLSACDATDFHKIVS